jgi:predicted MPP superfamily phosphohydrolase
MAILFSLLGVFVVGVLLGLYARFIEPNLLVVRKIRINIGLGLNSGDPLRIALISDLHYPRLTDYHAVRRVIEKANRFNPDLVFVLGDVFDKRRRDPAILPDDIKTVFQSIQSKSGVFGVLGNHDHWFDAPAIRNALGTQTEIRLIDNASVCLDLRGHPFYLTGVGDYGTGNANYSRAVRNVPEDASIILLSHNPDVVEVIRDPRILVQFSGHTHGGQVRLPFIGALRVPSKFGDRYSKGLSRRGNHLLYVTCGIGSIKRIRFLCPPEVTWVEIY